MDSLRVVDLEQGHASDAANGIAQLYAGDTMAIIVRGFLPASSCAEAVQSIESGGVELPRVPTPHLKGALYGRPLAASAPDLSDFLADVPAFAAGCDSLFGSKPSLAERFQNILLALGGGLPVELPRAPDGRPYAAACFRVLVEGDSLPPHAENQTLNRPASAHLKSLVDPTAIMSVYLPVQLPSGGGELTVVSMDRFRSGDGAIQRLGADQAVREFLASGARTVLPGPGDLLLFEGGRRYHWVSAIEGTRARWTLGAFFAYSRSHDRIYYWA